MLLYQSLGLILIFLGIILILIRILMDRLDRIENKLAGFEKPNTSYKNVWKDGDIIISHNTFEDMLEVMKTYNEELFFKALGEYTILEHE